MNKARAGHPSTVKTNVQCADMMRVGLVVATVFLPLLGGCFDAGERMGEANEPSAGIPGVWVFDSMGSLLPSETPPGGVPIFELRKVSDRRSGEPTLGVTRTGALFVTSLDIGARVTTPLDGANVSVPDSRLMRSMDAGLQWDDVSPNVAGTRTHTDSSDPYVYADPTTGRIFALDMSPAATCNRVSWSDDDGETWMTHPVACIPGWNDNPTLFAGPATVLTETNLYPNQVYLCVNGLTDTRCYQSPNGGLSWIALQPAFLGLYDDAAAVECHTRTNTGHGHASFVDGTIYIGRGYCDRVEAATSADGVTWRQSIVASGGEHAPAVFDVMFGSDSAGTAYAVWVGNIEYEGGYGSGADLNDEAGEGRTVFLARSHDRGETWGEPINVTIPGVTAVKLPTIVAGTAGRIAIAYIGTETPSGWRLAKCDRTTDTCEVTNPEEYENATWNAYMVYSDDADTPAPIFTGVRVNHIDAPLKRGYCIDRCDGDEGSMLDFMDIDIDPRTGQVFIALVDICSGDCDGPGKMKSEVYEKSVGVVAVQTAGPYLLDEPIAERQAGFLASRQVVRE